MSGILYDLAPAIATARAGHGGPLPRCELMVGDFFNRVPEGADIYLLKLILHDWDDRNSVRILKNCREVMNHGGRLLIMEGLVDSSDTLTMTDVVDLAMLANLSGRERTESEFATLLEKCSFQAGKNPSNKGDTIYPGGGSEITLHYCSALRRASKKESWSSWLSPALALTCGMEEPSRAP
jgi:hypothetical protein